MVGCLLTLALLTAIVVRCIWVARHAKTRQEGLVCIGVAGMVIFQVIVNVGMCLFVMPVIGLTLPFISYGGSSLLMLFISMGLVSGVQGRSKPGLAAIIASRGASNGRALFYLQFVRRKIGCHTGNAVL